MTDTTKPLYTDRIKLNRSNFNTESGKYHATSLYADGEKIDFAFEAKDYINKNGEDCIGNVHIPGIEYYVAIKKRQSKMGKIYYSGCVNYEKGLFVNVNIVATQDSVPEFTISFSKPATAAVTPLEAIPDNGTRTDGLPF